MAEEYIDGNGNQIKQGFYVNEDDGINDLEIIFIKKTEEGKFRFFYADAFEEKDLADIADIEVSNIIPISPKEYLKERTEEFTKLSNFIVSNLEILANSQV